MRTKRKRACKKPPARKSAALAKNEKAVNQSEKAVNQSEKAVNQNEKAVNQNEEAFLTFINQNSKEDSVSADPNDLEVVDKYDSDPDEAKSSSSSSPSSSSDSDKSFSSEESTSDDLVDRRSWKLTERCGNGKQKASKLLKKVREDDVKSSRVLRSSSKKHDEFMMPQQDPRYNKKELKAVLEVIKKIMKMDEAQPFLVSVDPVASGKPWELLTKSKTDYVTRHSGLEPFHQVGSAVDASQMQQDRLGFNQPYPHLPPLSYSQPHPLPQTPSSTAWPQFSHLPPVSYHQPCQSQHPQPSTNWPQFSQLQAHRGCNSADMAPKHKKYATTSKHKKNSSMGPAASIYDGSLSHSQSQHPQLSHRLPCCPQQSISQLQPSQLQSIADGGNSHLLPQADHTRSSGNVPWYPVDPMVVPGQPLPLESPLSHGESGEPQQLHLKASHCQPQSSQLQDNVDIGHLRMSLTDSALRGIRCALQYSARPTTNKSNQENQDRLAPVKLQPEQAPRSPEQLQLLKRKKRGRGPTRCLFLNDLADGERIFIHINKFGQPVGPESSKLSSFLGTIARDGNKAPLNFVHWRTMPDSYKGEIWEYVQTKFDLDPSGKSWVMQSLATKWRDWKADLKATYYDSLGTDEERLKVRDPRVVPDQWPSLISYWSSDDTKKRCATNRANRLKHRGAHSSGTKSYARIREEERNKRPDGKEPTRAELYILTHTRKNGQPVDETAAEFISKIREQEAEKQVTSQSSDESNDTLYRVMGVEKRNHVRTYGMGPAYADVYGPIPSRDDLMRMASEAKKSANEDVHKMIMKMEAMEERYAHMENHIARMTSNMEKFLEKISVSLNILGMEQGNYPEEDDA